MPCEKVNKIWRTKVQIVRLNLMLQIKKVTEVTTFCQVIGLHAK